MATRHFTRDGYNRLQSEIKRIEEIELPEVISLIADIQSDNYDFLEEDSALSDLLQRRDLLQERLSELRYILHNAEIIEREPDPDHVNVGDTVTLRDLDYDEEFTILLTDYISGADKEIRSISTGSAVGAAILGKRIGDTVTVEVPDGVVRYQIVRSHTPANT